MSVERIAAIVTAYHPDERLSAVVESALADCGTVIVADNTPGDAASLADKLDDSRVRVFRSGRNLGLAAALNLGLDHLPEDADAVLFLDQDSVLPAGLVAGLREHLEDPTVGIVGPAPVDAEAGGQYETFAGFHKKVDDRPSVITSGMLARRECFERVPRFREDFFVDCVDIDYCLRVSRAGLRVLRDTNLQLPHSIGDGRDHKVGGLTVRVLHYAAWRHYWIARNGMIVMRENLGRPMFVFVHALFYTRWLLMTALFEPKRRTHVAAYVRGMLDGVTGAVARKYIPAGAEYRGKTSES